LQTGYIRGGAFTRAPPEPPYESTPYAGFAKKLTQALLPAAAPTRFLRNVSNLAEAL